MKPHQMCLSMIKVAGLTAMPDFAIFGADGIGEFPGLGEIAGDPAVYLPLLDIDRRRGVGDGPQPLVGRLHGFVDDLGKSRTETSVAFAGGSSIATSSR